MRVAYFNELDSYALAENFNSRDIIDGVSGDPRIGIHYNNPSFGYGGYCLPKDTKQLLANFENTPQALISAVIKSNSIRQEFIVSAIIKESPSIVGIHTLAMKSGSDNYRESAVIKIISGLISENIEVVIYEPSIGEPRFMDCRIINDLSEFKNISTLIVANRLSNEIIDVSHKVFSRDLYCEN